MSFVGVVEFCVCPSFPFGFQGGIWDVIVLIPDHCLSIYFGVKSKDSSFYNILFPTSQSVMPVGCIEENFQIKKT